MGPVEGPPNRPGYGPMPGTRGGPSAESGSWSGGANLGVRAAATSCSAVDAATAGHSPEPTAPPTPALPAPTGPDPGDPANCPEPVASGPAVPAVPDPMANLASGSGNRPTPPGLVAPSRTTTSSGSQTSAVRPAPEAGRNLTLMPCLAARRATTKRPIRRDTATSTTGGLSSRQFA